MDNNSNKTVENEKDSLAGEANQKIQQEVADGAAELEELTKDLTTAVSDEIDLQAEMLDEINAEESGLSPETRVNSDKNKSARGMLLIFLALILVVTGILLFRQFSAKDSGKLETPLLFINENEELKIVTSDIETPSTLGNQGFAKETKLRPVTVSEDNQKIAYLTELGALFVVPTKESTAGIIDSKYLVSEKVSEVLTFAPDNNKILYFIDENGALAYYDGKATKVISDKFYSEAEETGLSIFSTVNNNRIMYYEFTEEKLVLCTQVVGKENSLKQFDESISNGIYEFDDAGFYFYQNKGNYETYGLTIYYFDFANENAKEMASTKDLYGIVALKDNGFMILLENIPKPEEEVKIESEAAAPPLEEIPTGDVADAQITGSEEIPADAQAAQQSYTLAPTSAEASQTEVQEIPEAEVTEIEVGEAASDGEAIEITPEELEAMGGIEGLEGLMGGTQEPETYNIKYYTGGEGIMLAENVNSPVYADKKGEFVIYSVTEGTTIRFYYKAVDGNSVYDAVELFSAEADQHLEFAESLENNTFALSRLNTDSMTATVTVYTRGAEGTIESEKVITDKAFSLTGNTVNGAYIIKENISEVLLGETTFYHTDIYTYKNGEYTEVAKNVEHFSMGRNLGSEQHDSVLVFITDVKEQDGLAMGQLNTYNGETVTKIADNFTLANPEATMSVIYENENRIYFFTHPSTEANSVNLNLYDGSEEPKLLEEGILGII